MTQFLRAEFKDLHSTTLLTSICGYEFLAHSPTKFILRLCKYIGVKNCVPVDWSIESYSVFEVMMKGMDTLYKSNLSINKFSTALYDLSL